jgi:hypothetical protein
MRSREGPIRAPTPSASAAGAPDAIALDVAERERASAQHHRSDTTAVARGARRGPFTRATHTSAPANQSRTAAADALG